MAKAEQAGLPGIPQPAKREIVDAIEDKCLERDKLAGKRTAMSVKIAEQRAEIQALLVKYKLESYTYEDSNGVLQDVVRETSLKKRKSQSNPKKGKKGDDE